MDLRGCLNDAQLEDGNRSFTFFPTCPRAFLRFSKEIESKADDCTSGLVEVVKGRLRAVKIVFSKGTDRTMKERG